MSTLSFSTLAMGLGLAAVSAAQEAGTESVKGSSVTINACVVAGKDDSYVLTHVREVSGLHTSLSTALPAGMTGMQGGAEEVIYWLSHDSIKLIDEHAGHRVQITGIITDESTGSVHLRKELGKPGADNDNKIEVSARGKEASADTDNRVKAGPGAVGKSDRTQTMPVRRVKVDSVKMLSATCP